MADEVDMVSDIAAGELDTDTSVGAVQAPSGAQPARGGDAVPANAVERTTGREGEKTSLRDQLSASFRKEGLPAEQAGADNNTGQPRDEQGKFAAAAAAEPGAADAAPVDQLQPLTPPQYMAGAEAEQFKALPVETQHMVARIMAPLEEAAARYVGYGDIERVIGPRREAWAVNGTSEGQALTQLFAISDFATRAPQDFIRWFAGTQGIELAALGVDAEDEEIDPTVRELRETVHTLNARLEGLTQGQVAVQHNGIVNEVQAFGSEAGTDGQPLRPYFAELGSAIIPYISQIKQEKPQASHRDVLTEAYERCCWATPTIRDKMLAAQEAHKLAQRTSEADRRRQAGSSIGSEAPSQGATQKRDIGTGSVRETLQGAIALHS